MTALLLSLAFAVPLVGAGMACCGLAMHSGLQDLPGAAGTSAGSNSTLRSRLVMPVKRVTPPAARLRAWLLTVRELLRGDPDAPSLAGFGPFENGHDLAVLMFLQSVHAPAETEPIQS